MTKKSKKDNKKSTKGDKKDENIFEKGLHWTEDIAQDAWDGTKKGVKWAKDEIVGEAKALPRQLKAGVNYGSDLFGTAVGNLISPTLNRSFIPIAFILAAVLLAFYFFA